MITKTVGLRIGENNVILGYEQPPTLFTTTVELDSAALNGIVFGLSTYQNGQVNNPTTEEKRAFEEKTNADNFTISDQQKYEDRVVELIRRKYSLSQELAILRQRDTKPEEFAEYNSYVEECKTIAKQEILGG